MLITKELFNKTLSKTWKKIRCNYDNLYGLFVERITDILERRKVVHWDSGTDIAQDGIEDCGSVTFCIAALTSSSFISISVRSWYEI